MKILKEDRENLETITHLLSHLICSLPKLQTNTLSEIQIEILIVVKKAQEENETLTLGDILKKLKSRYNKLTLNIISQSTKKLSKSGLVKKTHSTKDDRKVEVEITTKGKILIRKSYKLWQHHLSRLIANLDEEEKNNFIGLLKRITSVI